MIINLLTFLRTMNKNKNKKKTTKRVEKVNDVDDVVLEEKEYLPQPLRYLPQPLRRKGAQIACKPDIPPQILLQTSPQIRAQKRLACSIPLTVFTARADAVLRPPCPQGRSPSLWEGRDRFWGRDRVDIEEPRWVSPLLWRYWERFSDRCRLTISDTLPYNLNHSTHQSQPLCKAI